MIVVAGYVLFYGVLLALIVLIGAVAIIEARNGDLFGFVLLGLMLMAVGISFIY